MEWPLILLIIFGSLILLMMTGMPVAISFILINIVGVALVWHGAVGIRAHIACRILISNGFKNVRNFSGGYTTYSVASKDYTIG